jgi:hypothetical protein
MWVVVSLGYVLGVVAALGAGFGVKSAQAGLVLTQPRANPKESAVSDQLGTSQVRPKVIQGRKAPLAESSNDEPVYQRRQTLSADAQGIVSGTSDRGLSLNEIELKKMREEFTYRRNLAEAKKPKAAPASKPKAANNQPMKTEVIGAPPKNESAEEADEPEVNRGNEPNPAFVYTHLLPSPMNIPGGSWVLGTTAAIGVTDFLQFSTNVIRDVTGYLNVQAKVPLIEYPTFIASAYVSWDHFNLNSYDKTNPDMKIRAWQPGLVTGYEINSDMAFFVGGNFNATHKEIPNNIRTSGYARGAQLEVDWSWLYNPASSRLGDNALSAGATYDFTYSLIGFGVTHHWPTFELGMHYVFNADRYRVLPLLNVSVGFTF